MNLRKPFIAGRSAPAGNRSPLQVYALVGAVGIALGCADAPTRSGSAAPSVPVAAHPPRPAPAQPANANAAYRSCVVAADHEAASRAGLEVLRAGGNAVDAAVATAFALSVVRPESCGIGGGGFMLIHLVDDPRIPGVQPLNLCLDYRERCPAAIGPDSFESLPDDASTFSGKAVAIPGTVAGLLAALERFGTMDRGAVLAPAIRVAREGFTSGFHLEASALELKETLEVRARSPLAGDAMLSRLYGLHDPYPPARITNSEQARALELIATRGLDGFRAGELGLAIVAAAGEAGGVLTLDDLATAAPREVRPLVGDFRGRRILTMPLPSSGGITILETLGLFERRAELWKGEPVPGVRSTHVLTECFKLAFADRASYLGDPRFLRVDPTPALLDPGRLDRRAALIEPQRTFEPDFYARAEPLPDDGGTSHLCVVDRWGNAVACTETINLEFGSRIGVPGFGFCLNNEMDDFATRRGRPNAFGLTQSDRNLPEPGKTPLSSMSPTVVLDSTGQVELIVGASGGPRIITATTQVLINTLVYGMSAADAVGSPRIHHQWSPDILRVEKPRTEWCTTSGLLEPSPLELKGHTVKPMTSTAEAQLIARDGAGGWQAACDPRKGGAPAGE